MKKIFLGLLFVFFIQILNAQVSLYEGSLAEALVKAKDENKMVMVIASTTWCGPCKHLTNVVLQEPGAAEYFGPRFVVKKYYLDKEDSDNIAEKFEVVAYPTIIFLDGSGNEIIRILGSSPRLKDFINKIETALLPENTFASREARLKKNPSYALEYATFLMNDCRMFKRSSAVIEEQFATSLNHNLFTKEAWDLYQNLIPDVNAPLIDVLLKNHDRICEVYSAKEFHQWLQDEGDRLLLSFYLNNPTKKRKNMEVFSALKEKPLMQGAFYKLFLNNFDILFSDDHMKKFELIKKQAFSTKNTIYRMRLVTMILKTTSYDFQKQRREDFISFFEKLAEIEKNENFQDRYLNMVEKLKNLDD